MASMLRGVGVSRINLALLALLTFCLPNAVRCVSSDDRRTTEWRGAHEALKKIERQGKQGANRPARQPPRWHRTVWVATSENKWVVPGEIARHELVWTELLRARSIAIDVARRWVACRLGVLRVAIALAEPAPRQVAH